MDQNTSVYVAARNGDTTAIAKLMEISIPYVRKMVNLYYARERLSWSDAEDLTQDIMLDVYSHLYACKHETWDGFLAWLRISSIHEIYRMVEKQQAMKRGGGVAKYEDTEPSHSRSPDSIASEKEQNMATLRLVAGLDESQRDVFLMALDGASSRDISEEPTMLTDL